jgi:hypothetical protein
VAETSKQSGQQQMIELLIARQVNRLFLRSQLVTNDLSPSREGLKA